MKKKALRKHKLKGNSRELLHTDNNSFRSCWANTLRYFLYTSGRCERTKICIQPATPNKCTHLQWLLMPKAISAMVFSEGWAALMYSRLWQGWEFKRVPLLLQNNARCLLWSDLFACKDTRSSHPSLNYLHMLLCNREPSTLYVCATM